MADVAAHELVERKKKRMSSLSDNMVHLLALLGLLATCVLLVLFGHQYINSDYVFGTSTTLAGALFGYRFGVGVIPPDVAAQLAQAQALLQAQNPVPARAPEPTPIIIPSPHA